MWQAAVAGLVLLQSACASHGVSIELANGTRDEIATRVQLQRLLERYDLEEYLFTQRVRIDREQVPHSHPVLTLHTRHVDEDDLQLSTFLHEQLHWYLESRRVQTWRAIAELKRMYPDAPWGFPEGARDQHSTYLHLLVNQLEYEALSGVIGENRADDAFRFWRDDHYTWIYQNVLEDGALLHQVLERHHLSLGQHAGRSN